MPSCSTTRRRPTVVVATMLAASIIVPASAEAATGTTATGETDSSIGPKTAYVDPRFATYDAAVSTVKELRQLGPPVMPGPPGATSTLDPSIYGQWSTLGYDLPLRAVHVTLLKTGNLLLVAGSGNVSSDNVLGDFKAYLWNPTTGALTAIPVPYDAFCGGHLVDANGDVTVYGGTTHYKDASSSWVGSNKVYKYVVSTNQWVAMPSMTQGRWYPSMVMDGKKRQFAFSGLDATGKNPSTPEMFDPATNTWTNVAARGLPLYAGLQLLANGKFGYAGAHFGGSVNPPKVFDPMTGSFTYASDPGGVIDLAHRNMGMAAMVGSADRQRVWVAGGLPAVATTYFMDFAANTPLASAGPALPTAKGYVSVADLPDLSALETGGGTGTDSPVYEASILDTSTDALTPVAPPAQPRTYHSSALTMPDGRVVTFGGDPAGDAVFNYTIEVFSPPYLFKGTRPVITAATTEMHYGHGYTLTAAATGTSLASAVLLRPGSATHSMDSSQRALKLVTSPATGGLRITVPTNPNLAPPGWYMLFVNDGLGRPSVAHWIHLT